MTARMNLSMYPQMDMEAILGGRCQPRTRKGSAKGLHYSVAMNPLQASNLLYRLSINKDKFMEKLAYVTIILMFLEPRRSKIALQIDDTGFQAYRQHLSCMLFQNTIQST